MNQQKPVLGADTITYSVPPSTQLRTKLSREQLVVNAKALGFDVNDSAALMCAAMVSDPEFRERVIRLSFEKALSEVRK